MVWLSFVVALICGLIFLPIVRKYSYKWGFIAQPRDDRWHDKPTATLGGVGIFAAFICGLLVIQFFIQDLILESNTINQKPMWGLLAGSILIFVLGIIDDLKQISPPIKLVWQLIAAVIVVSLGYTTDFFTPRIADETIAQLLNVISTIVWIVGITNAINLLDNMDGLAGGISLIAALILSYLFWKTGNIGLMAISLSLSGAIFSFLFFNFPPASIFMGDSGSLFIGFTLAVLAIARQPQASNVFAVLGVPTLLFLLPIFDTGLVAFTRILRGQSPAKGGSDHTSHRLVAFGLTERQALLFLYFIAIITGFAAISIETLGYWLSIVLVPLIVLTFAIIIAYLGGLKVINEDSSTEQSVNIFSKLIFGLTYRRRLLEIVLDLLIIGLAYYLSFLIKFDLEIPNSVVEELLKTLPVVMIVSIATYVLFGVYRGLWRYLDLNDLLRFTAAILVSLLLIMLSILIIFPQQNIDLVVFILFSIFLFLGLLATRASFRVLDMASVRLQYKQPVTRNVLLPKTYDRRDESVDRILIIGAGKLGELALRWIQVNPQMNIIPIGFVDNDPILVNREIHGVAVLGQINDLPRLIGENFIDGILISDVEKLHGQLNEFVSDCSKLGCWVRRVNLGFEKI